MKNKDIFCDTFWGSHGCDLVKGHEGPHLCIGTYSDDGKHSPDEICSTPEPEQLIFSLYS